MVLERLVNANVPRLEIRGHAARDDDGLDILLGPTRLHSVGDVHALNPKRLLCYPGSRQTQW